MARGREDRPAQDAPPRAVESLTGQQLERRRRITDAVIDLVAESGPEALQMREVTARSGVALATVYRYFSSKDHLLAAAVADWQDRLTEQVLAETVRRHEAGGPEEPAVERVLRFARRELRAFQRHPHFARLMVGLLASSDPYASETLARMNRSSDRAMDALLHDVAEPVARTARVAIQAVVMTGLIGWVTGRKTWAEILRDLEMVAGQVLADAGPPPAGPAPLRHGGS